MKMEGNDLEPLTERAVQLAQLAADAPEPIVFCPPPATFKNAANAKEENVAEAPVLCVECDSNPKTAQQKLEAVLGPATIVVASGGQWVDPKTGQVENKVHLYWRLREPAAGDALKTLRQARRLATRYVDGDPTCISLAHPMRWPGSWHCKAEPKMARIIALNDSTEIALDEALQILRGVFPNDASASGDRQADDREGDQRTTIELMRLISSGESFHPAILSLAARWLGMGVSPGCVINSIRELMEQIPGQARRPMACAFQRYLSDC